MNSKILLGLMTLVLISPLYANAAPGTISVDIDGTSVAVNYDATGLEITGNQADLDFVSLIVQLDVTEATNVLEISFDREFFDATSNGEDIEYFVLVDGFDEISYEEVVTSSMRTLTMNIPLGTEEIEIIGTSFGVSTSEETMEETTEETMEETTEETMEETTEETQCGEGTVLKDGACILDESCGSGTILKDGECVVERSGFDINLPSMFDLYYGAGFAFAIAFAVIVILGLIARASKS